MPAIVRVKRRIDEEPLNAFVLNGKKRRLDVSAAAQQKDDVSTILKFAGTLTDQDNEATTKYARLRKGEAKELIKQKARKSAASTVERQRKEQRETSHENRFRVVNCMRTTLNEDGDANGDLASGGVANHVTIVDIEKDQATASRTVLTEESMQCDAAATTATTSTHSAMSVESEEMQQQPVDSDTGYVYDLYLPENEAQGDYVDLMDDYHLRVRALDQIYFEDCYDGDSDVDSEDSNDENHAGNDYPDEESVAEDESDEESRELRKAVKNFILADDDEEEEERNESFGGYRSSSSDDEYFNGTDDPYIHHVEPDDNEFVDDVDKYTADRYGTAYARYRARILQEEKPKRADDDDDSSSDNLDYYD